MRVSSEVKELARKYYQKILKNYYFLYVCNWNADGITKRSSKWIIRVVYTCFEIPLKMIEYLYYLYHKS